MYSAIDVAEYIVEYCNDHNYGVSNLKLQKLLYFVQAYFLIASQNACFYEEIEAWDFGPVVPSVYSKFKQFGSTDIPKMPNLYSVILNHDKKLIDAVIEKFRGYTSTDLVQLTHNQDPWRNAHAKGYNGIITKEAIRSYFAGK